MLRRLLHRPALRVFAALPRRLRHRAVRILSPTWTAGTVAAIVDPDQRLLMVRHSYNRGWSLPGGLLDAGELPRDAVVREVHEELGITVDPDERPAVVPSPDRAHFNFVFGASVDAATAAAAERRTPEITELRWFRLDALPPTEQVMDYTDELLAAVGLWPTPER